MVLVFGLTCSGSIFFLFVMYATSPGLLLSTRSFSQAGSFLSVPDPLHLGFLPPVRQYLCLGDLSFVSGKSRSEPLLLVLDHALFDFSTSTHSSV